MILMKMQQYAESKVEQNLIVQGIMDAEGLSLDDDESDRIKGRAVIRIWL